MYTFDNMRSNQLLRLITNLGGPENEITIIRRLVILIVSGKIDLAVHFYDSQIKPVIKH